MCEDNIEDDDPQQIPSIVLLRRVDERQFELAQIRLDKVQFQHWGHLQDNTNHLDLRRDNWDKVHNKGKDVQDYAAIIEFFDDYIADVFVDLAILIVDGDHGHHQSDHKHD